MADEPNGRACCLLAICCDKAAQRVDSLASMFVKHCGLEAGAAEAVAGFVLEHFGLVTKVAAQHVVAAVKAANAGGAPVHPEVAASYAKYFSQAKAEGSSS